MQKQLLVSQEIAAEMILNGAVLSIAGDESVLATLPCGNWIGGTIPYFMAQDGGITTRDQLFITELQCYTGLLPTIKLYDVSTLAQVCADAPANGYSIIILPAFSEVHFEYAEHASSYGEMFMKPLVGWVSGIHLDDMGRRSPKVRDGRTSKMLDDQAIVIHIPLPENVSANVNIVNLFNQGDGDSIEFQECGFEASTCLVNGKSNSFVKYLKHINHDQQLPLVADYSGALINVSIKAINEAQDRVEFYGPVFQHVSYKLAAKFSGNYEVLFNEAITHLPMQADFSCNCILNYLYCGLEGKHTGQVTGPMTFGEIAYVLLNQTMVHLTLQTY